MIFHLVLFKPRANITASEREGLLDAIRVAHEEIPSIRRFFAGTRFVTGRPYDQTARDFPYFAAMEFESRADLAAYLAHPAHERLGQAFYSSSEASEAYDFEGGEVPGILASLVE